MSVSSSPPSALSAPSRPPVQADNTPAPPERCLSSDTLLQGNKCVAIAHNGAIYRLQATRLGKLILTK